MEDCRRLRHRGTDDKDRNGPRYDTSVSSPLNCEDAAAAAADPRTFYRNIETDLIATAHIRARIVHLRLCGGRSGTGADFSASSSVRLPPISMIPPMPRTVFISKSLLILGK
jgi:hypothetical protein